MTKPAARVTSIDSIRTFKVALEKYEQTVGDVLATLLFEVRRAVDWIEQDRMVYWPAQVRMASDQLTQALNNLERKQIAVGQSDKPSCFEEKQAVEQARRRLRYAEQKVERTRHWLRVVRHEAEEFQGLIGKTSNFVEADLPRAIANLEKMATALDRYAGGGPMDPTIGSSEGGST